MYEHDLYLNEWQGGDTSTLKKAFALDTRTIDSIEILLASYTRDALCGEAFVLFKQDGRLYEVNASHDSSDGMHDQWDPEETLLAALRYRLEKGRLGRSDTDEALFVSELAFLLAELEANGYR